MASKTTNTINRRVAGAVEIAVLMTGVDEELADTGACKAKQQFKQQFQNNNQTLSRVQSSYYPNTTNRPDSPLEAALPR